MSARTSLRHPGTVAARAWRATVPGGETPQNGVGSAILLALVALAFLYILAGSPAALPWSTFLPLIVVSGVIHSPREHAFVVAATLGCVAAGGLLSGVEHFPGAAGSFIAGVVIASVTMWRSLARARVGVQGTRGEALLDELREGLEQRGRLPQVAPGWSVEGTVDSAFGHPFSGDFIVSHYCPETLRLEAALVDVSGKGLRSASRAVQLSGALDALIGAIPAEDFLQAANDYVVRQRWVEGYATLVHVTLDLATGDFTVWRAGHPPAAVFRSGSGSWDVLEEHVGPALGLVEQPVYRCDEGTLRSGDALMLYSDGLIEAHGRTLDDGIERLLGKAAGLVMQGFDGGTERLCAEAACGKSDDRSVVLLWRN